MSEALLGTQFGTSEYGERLEYKKPVPCRDVFWSILYYLHLVGMLVASILVWGEATPSTDTDDDSDTVDVSSWSGLFYGVMVAIVLAFIFALIWLAVIQKFAKSIIQFMLMANVAVMAVAGVIMLIKGVVAAAIIYFVFAAFLALYAYCVWNRIALAAAMIEISARIISTYPGTIVVSIFVLVLDLIYVVLWISTLTGYLTYASNNDVDHVGWAVFGLLIALYWAFQVNKNISHTTTCGVAGTWYFSSEEDMVRSPTSPALSRTMGTSFGSVCFGSLLIAIIQAMRSMLRNAKRNRNIICVCIAYILLSIIEALAQIFNRFAYAFVALYGTSFISSAKSTWELFKKRGITAIINDDLSSLPISLGSLLCGAIAFVVAYFWGQVWYSQFDEQHDDIWYDVDAISYVMGLIAFIISLPICVSVLYTVLSAVTCIFVAYAEAPDALKELHPTDYNNIAAAKPELADIAPGAAIGAPVAQEGENSVV